MNLGHEKLLKKESFDLVLSDVRLPEGDGISLLEWMRKERMDIPFIIMTGYASVPDAVQAIKLGAIDYLAKTGTDGRIAKTTERYFPSQICDMRQEQGFAPQKQPSDAGGRTSGQYSRPI